MKKIVKWAGCLLVPVVILFFAVFLNREPLSYFIVQKAAQYFAGRVHIAVDIGAISGRPLSETTLNNVTLRPAVGQPQVYSFKAETITCSYNLWDLKQGYEFFLQGLNCSVDAPEFAYDFRLASVEYHTEGETTSFFIPVILPRLALENGLIVLDNSDWSVAISNLNGKLHLGSAGHELQLEVGTFRFMQDGVTRIDTGFKTRLQYSEEKLVIHSLDAGEKGITAKGFIDLSRFDQEHIGFAADLRFAESLLNVSGSMDRKLLKLQTGTDNFDIGELQRRLGRAGWDISGKMRAQADFTYNLKTHEQLSGTFTVDVLEGELHGVSLESASAAGSFDNEIFKVSSAEARTAGNHVIVKDLTVPMHLLRKGKIASILARTEAEFSADVANAAILQQIARIKGDVLPASIRLESLTILGRLEKETLFVEDAKAAAADSSLTIDRAAIPIPAAEGALQSLPIEITARLKSSNLQKITGLFVDIPFNGQAVADINISGTMAEAKAQINISGEYLTFKEMQIGSLALVGDFRLIQEKLRQVKSFNFEITEITQENGSGVLSLLAPATGTWQDDLLKMNGTFHLDGKGEIAMGISRAPGKEIAMEISTRSLDSDGWLGNYINPGFFFHGADVEAVLLGIPENTQLQLSGTVSEAGASDVDFPLSGSFNLFYSYKGIEISEFIWKSFERNQLTISGFLPYDPLAEEPFLKGELSLAGEVDFPSLEDVAVFLEPWGIGKGSVALNMDLTGSWQQPQGHVILRVEDLEPPDSMRNIIESPVDISADVEARGETITLNAASLESVQYSAQATGSWQHGISVGELLEKRTLQLHGEVQADAVVQLKDLNFLRRKLPWLRRLEGDMRGELHVSGPVTGPSLKGSFSLKDAEASHTFNFPMLAAADLHGEFDEHSITINNMQAELGGSPVNLSGSINRKDEAVNVSLHIDGRNVLLFRNNDMRMRGNVQLEVSGPLERLQVKGTTGLTGGYFTKNFDFLGTIGGTSAPVSEGVGFLFSFTDPPLKDAVLDIKITTIEPFKIRNNLIRGTLRPELFLKGTGELPFLVGNVYIDPARVLLPSGRLQVQSGLLRFQEGEPDRPQLDLIAQSRLLGYDINLVTQGPIDDPVITLSSSPTLPNDDLLLLLLTGQPPREDIAGGAQSRGTTNVMVYLGRDFLNKWLEDETGASDETILDRFELDFGRNVTKSGEQTIESTFRLSEYTTGAGRIYYLAGEKDKYDAYNYGLRLVFRFE